MPQRKTVTRKTTPSKKSLKRLIQDEINSNLETKQKVEVWNSVGVTDSARTPPSSNITGIAQGDTQSTREGNQIRITGVYGKWLLTKADTTNVVRVIFYKPKQVGDALSGIDINDAVDMDKFHIYSDNLYLLNANTPQKVIYVSKKFPGKGLVVQYHGTASTDVATNDIRLYAVSDSTAVSDPTMSGNFRFYFKDA